MTLGWRLLPADVPVDLGGDQARELAQRELARDAYRAQEPGLITRGLDWLLDRVGELLSAAGDLSPGGPAGLLVILAVVVAVVIVARRYFGRVTRRIEAAPALFDAAPRTADDHRGAADAAEADGRFDDAVRERMRALVRGLEERDLIEARPGRTAGEAARAAAAAVPSATDATRDAARSFDETVYGGRTADAATAARVRAADDAVRAARPAART